MKLSKLKMLWASFGNICVDEDDNIESDFIINLEDGNNIVFKKGTDKDDIWHWFDEKCPNNLHDDLMFA